MDHPQREAALDADRVEAHAFADLYAAAPAALAARLGLRCTSADGVTQLQAPGLPDTMFNRVIGLGNRRAATAADLDALIDAYRSSGAATGWWLHWSPTCAEPAGFVETIAARGFTAPRRRSWAKVCRDSAPPPIATDLIIGPCRDGDAAATAETIAQAFGMPPFMVDWLAALHGRPGWRIYSVRDGDRVVGGGTLFVHGRLGWLGMGGVLPSHRRRGGQGALMARRAADAFAAGCTRVVTETGEPIGDEPNPSLANMRRCGFETVASRLNFAAPPA